MLEPMRSFELLVGRVFLSAIFIMSGTMKVLHWSNTAASMENEGMPLTPFFLFMATVLEIGAGMFILFGFKTTWSALALAAFLIPVTLIFHDFWRFEGQQMEQQMQHFLKNLTIIGGLLALAAAGGGRYSLDAITPRPTLAKVRSDRQSIFAP